MSDNVTHLHGVHPSRPEINGRSFSEIAGLPPELAQDLCDREMVFLTSFTRNLKTCGGDIIARDWAHAERLAVARGLGETVDGCLVATVPA